MEAAEKFRAPPPEKPKHPPRPGAPTLEFLYLYNSPLFCFFRKNSNSDTKTKSSHGIPDPSDEEIRDTGGIGLQG